MLNNLLKRAKVSYPSGASVDSYGRISRFPNETYAGTTVTTYSALSVPGLWRGITLISDAIGGLPIDAYRNGEQIPTPPLLSRPNPPETRIETIAAAVATCIIHGNYIAILGPMGANGYPDTIFPVNPERVTFFMDEGRCKYRIDGIVFDQSEVMHVKGFSLPVSMLAVASSPRNVKASDHRWRCTNTRRDTSLAVRRRASHSSPRTLT